MFDLALISYRHLPGIISFLVLRLLLVHSYLANVVQESNDGNGFIGQVHIRVKVPLAFFQGAQALINMDTVLHQPAGVGQVEAGAGRGCEEVGGLQPLQELLSAGPGDVFAVNLQKFFFHHKLSFFLN